MKKAITLIFVYFFVNNMQASTDSLSRLNDSNYCVEVSDSCLTYQTNELNIKTETKEPNTTTKIKLNKTTNSSLTKPANWFSDAWDWLTDWVKPVWGYYEEDGQRREGPYFLFDRLYDGPTYTQIQMQITQDKIKIIPSTENEIYKKVFEQAGTSIIENCSGTNLCPSAARAKASAFVYLVGLKADGTSLSPSERDGYRNRALAYLRDVDAPGLNNAVDFFNNYIPGLNLYNNISPLNTVTAAAFLMWEQMVWRSKELQMICQAWDMLRWCYNIDPTLPNDGLVRSRLKEAGERIKDYYVVPLHRRAQLGTYKYAHNNYNLMVGSALASAAICFNDYGAYVWQFEQRPSRWANSAYYNIHKVMWNDGFFYGKKMSMPGNTYGYAEGPYYFRFAFENMIPMFLARHNFAPDDRTNSYNSFTLDPFPNYVRNFWHDPDYKNLYKWYTNLTQSDGQSPAIDASWSDDNFNTAMAILRKSGGAQYNVTTNISSLYTKSGFSLREDYLAANNPAIQTIDALPQSVQMASGDIVVRNRPSEAAEKGRHYIHINAEKESATNGDKKEHNDFGSFIITAGNDMLIMDPPMYNSDDMESVNKKVHHNTITTNGLGFDGGIKEKLEDTGPIATVKLTTNLGSTRTFIINREDNDGDLGYHYVVVDEVNLPLGKEFSVHLNGNGNVPNTFSSSTVGVANWYYPCQNKNGFTGNTGEWGIRAIVNPSITINTSNSPFHFDYLAKHGSFGITTHKSPDFENEGSHAKYTYKINTSQPFTVTTLLQPRRCIDGTLGKIIQGNNNGVSRVLMYNSSDTNLNRVLYVTKNTDLIDTVCNPFGINNNSILSTNSKISYVNYVTDSLQKFGYCNTYSIYKSASMLGGSLLVYTDSFYNDTLIKSSKPIDAYYKLTGRYKYEGYVNITNPNNKGTKVSFLLPDLDTNQIMVMTSTNNKSFGKATYHKATRVIENTFDTGLTHFVFELADPCQQSCFFPQVPNQIDDTFDFGTGGLERLGRDLDILPDSGWLNMTNGSKISICEGFVLVNQDSITMVGALGGDNEEDGGSVSPNLIVYGSGKLGSTSEPSGTPAGTPNVTSVTYLTSKDTDPLIYGKKGKKSQRCMIIINNKAALVLDSGSRTHIGANSTILVRKGGTLLIKKHAFVEIGSKHNTGMKQCFGEILAEDSAFVCIEDSSDIHFFINNNDSSDKNRFYVTTYDSLPVHHKTYAYVNIDGARGKFKTIDHFGDSGRFRIHNCVNFCSLKSLAGMAPDGINNRHFGWSNINRPSVRFNINDTFCLGDGGYIFEGEKSLNETWFKMRIDRIRFVGNSIQIPPVIDTISLHEGTVIGANTDITMVEEVENFRPEFEFDSSGLYRVRLRVYNSCPLEEDEKFKFFHLRRKLNPNLKILTPEICPGIETLEAADSTYEDFQRYGTKWHIHLIDTTDVAVQKIFYGQDWEFEQKISPFNFPGFNLIGGVRYAISLTITNECGTFTKWDTVLVKPGAFINMSAAKNYAQEISTGIPIQLNAYIPHADTFAWNPTTYLDTAYSRHPIATPTEDMQYVLTAYSGNCVATDTAIVKYNQYASAGYNDTLCNGTPDIMIGNPYHQSLFLTCMYHADPALFIASYNQYNTFGHTVPFDHLSYGNPHSFRYFTHFMHSDLFKTVMSNNHAAAYNFFVNTLNKKQAFKNQVFINDFYKKLIDANNTELSVLEQFNTHLYDVFNNEEVETMALFRECIDQILSIYYNSYLPSQIGSLQANWTKTIQDQTTPVMQWKDEFVLIDAPTQTTKYNLSVITSNKAELDEITIFVDSALSPLFYPVMQFDSTVILQNATYKPSSTNTFEWNFGDGSPHEFTENVMHTFPAFDSNYVVCLTATNKCGSQTYCDTVRIDSAHLGGINKTITQAGMSAIPSNPNSSNESQKLTSSRHLLEARGQQLITLTNYPNPFNQNTVIAYQIWQKYQTAELRITNIWGQELITQKLNKPIDYIQIDGSTLADGLYYYSIVVDGTVAQTKTMSVIK